MLWFRKVWGAERRTWNRISKYTYTQTKNEVGRRWKKCWIFVWAAFRLVEMPFSEVEVNKEVAEEDEVRTNVPKDFHAQRMTGWCSFRHWLKRKEDTNLPVLGIPTFFADPNPGPSTHSWGLSFIIVKKKTKRNDKATLINLSSKLFIN